MIIRKPVQSKNVRVHKRYTLRKEKTKQLSMKVERLVNPFYTPLDKKNKVLSKYLEKIKH